MLCEVCGCTGTEVNGLLDVSVGDGVAETDVHGGEGGQEKVNANERK